MKTLELGMGWVVVALRTIVPASQTVRRGGGAFVRTGTYCYMYCQHYGHEGPFMLVRRYMLYGSNAYKDVYQLQVERAPMSCSSQRCLMRLPRPTCESVFAFQTYVENDPSHEYSKFLICSQNDSLSCGCLDDKGSAQHGRMTGHECV